MSDAPDREHSSQIWQSKSRHSLEWMPRVPSAPDAFERSLSIASRSVRISPTLTEMATYPFVRLAEERRRLEPDRLPVVDFRKGGPNEPARPPVPQAPARNH